MDIVRQNGLRIGHVYWRLFIFNKTLALRFNGDVL